MSFNSAHHRQYLASLKSYVPSPGFMASVGWGQQGFSHIVKDKETSDVVTVIMVGKVVDDRIFCNPSGNWSPSNKFGSLKNAKFQFALCRPDNDIFGKDYDTAFQTLSKMQTAIATTANHEHMLIGEKEKMKNIKFSAQRFQRNVKRYFPFFFFFIISIHILDALYALQPIAVPPSSPFPGAILLSDLTSTPPPDALEESTPFDGTLSDTPKQSKPHRQPPVM